MMLTRTKRGVVRAAQGAVAYVGRDTVPLRAAAVDSPCGSFATSWTPGILGRRMPGSGSTQPGVCSGGQQGHVGFAVGGYAAAGVHTGAAQLNADDALWLEELVELLATTRGGGDGLRVLCDSAKQQTTLKSILQELGEALYWGLVGNDMKEDLRKEVVGEERWSWEKRNDGEKGLGTEGDSVTRGMASDGLGDGDNGGGGDGGGDGGAKPEA